MVSARILIAGARCWTQMVSVSSGLYITILLTSCKTAKMVASAIHRYGWDPENGAWDIDLDADTAWIRGDRPIPVCNPIFKYLSFGHDPLPTWFSNPRDLYLRNDSRSEELRHTPLACHAVALRSFAAFPAVTTMWFDFSDPTRGTPSNLSGVTVWDAMRCLHSKYALFSSYTAGKLILAISAVLTSNCPYPILYACSVARFARFTLANSHRPTFSEICNDFRLREVCGQRRRCPCSALRM